MLLCISLLNNKIWNFEQNTKANKIVSFENLVLDFHYPLSFHPKHSLVGLDSQLSTSLHSTSSSCFYTSSVQFCFALSSEFHVNKQKINCQSYRIHFKVIIILFLWIYSIQWIFGWLLNGNHFLLQLVGTCSWKVQLLVYHYIFIWLG